MTTSVFAAGMTPAINGGDGTNEVYTKDGSSIFLGGRAEFRGDFIGSDTGGDIEGTMADKSRARINIGGMSEITDSFSAFGFYEAEQVTTGDTGLAQRYAYVGLMGDFGAISFGKQNTANVQLSNMSDIGTYTCDQKAFIAAGNEQQTIFRTLVNSTLYVSKQVISPESKKTLMVMACQQSIVSRLV